MGAFIHKLNRSCTKCAFDIITLNVWASYDALTPLPYRSGVMLKSQTLTETVAFHLKSAFKLSSKVNVAEHIFKLIASHPLFENRGIRSEEVL
mgnify:CR=1 FL=1